MEGKVQQLKYLAIICGVVLTTIYSLKSTSLLFFYLEPTTIQVNLVSQCYFFTFPFLGLISGVLLLFSARKIGVHLGKGLNIMLLSSLLLTVLIILEIFDVAISCIEFTCYVKRINQIFIPSIFPIFYFLFKISCRKSL
jgi:hypothetical protein